MVLLCFVHYATPKRESPCVHSAPMKAVPEVYKFGSTEHAEPTLLLFAFTTHTSIHPSARSVYVFGGRPQLEGQLCGADTTRAMIAKKCTSVKLLPPLTKQFRRQTHRKVRLYGHTTGIRYSLRRGIDLRRRGSL
jgi:hypothetical protein